MLHLGDYIYEYGPMDPWVKACPVRWRRGTPSRRASARPSPTTGSGTGPTGSMPTCRQLHRRHPVIAVWDDHEIANDTWRGGAENHDAGEGSWASRSRGGRRAWMEWLPVRQTGRSSRFRIHRRFRFGRHVELWMLDERRFRDQPSDSVALSAGSVDPSRHDPGRTMLGERQAAWLSDGLADSKATWKVIGNQVPFFPTVIGPSLPGPGLGDPRALLAGAGPRTLRVLRRRLERVPGRAASLGEGDERG